MTQAIVTGAFMAPEGTQLVTDDGLQPAPRILRPGPPDGPVVVEMSTALFKRHFKLGNVEAMRSHRLLAEAKAKAAHAMREAEAAADLAREEALADVEKASLDEDIAALSEMDKSELVELALAHKLKVSTRRSETNLRADIASALQEKLAELK